MKLLTKSGLLYSAVQAQTVDGHYGSFPEIDWSATVQESVTKTAIPGTLGLNPMVRSLETCWDGGKLMSGFGWYTGTVTQAWMMKIFGDDACAGVSAVNVPTGYTVFAIGLATTAANCITTTHWVWTPTGLALTTSALIIDAAEEWKNGAKGATAAAGEDPLCFAIGGMNQQASFGLGIWGFMTWATNNKGILLDSTLYGGGATFTPLAAALGSDKLDVATTADIAVTTAGMIGSSIGNQSSCGTSINAYAINWASSFTDHTSVVTGGFGMSVTSCLDYVTDEMSVNGTPLLYAYDTGVMTTDTTPLPVLQMIGSATGALQYLYASAPADNMTGNLVFAFNYGSIKKVAQVLGTDTQVLSMMVLFSVPEQYGKSVLQGYHIATNIVIDVVATAASFDTTQLLYGQINDFWIFSQADATTGLWGITSSHVAFVGNRLGKGMAAALDLSATRGFATAADTLLVAPTDMLQDAATGVSFVNNTRIREIQSPTGGIMQFKGLTQSAIEQQYVQVICRKIQGYFAHTAFQDIANTVNTTSTSGFIITCMTGISGCVYDNMAIPGSVTEAGSLLTATEHVDCMNDPRYMTWRQMTVQIDWDGTVQWWRTDSYWNPSDYVIASCWGPGNEMSSHIASTKDNTTITAADKSKSYVFVLSDGSGVQLSHLTGGSALATAPTSNTTGGSGPNTLTASPTSFKRASPNRVDQNYCSDTNLNLTGLADTSALAATVTAYSDGYQATITMGLDWVQAGAQGGWRGVCMVYYTSQYIQDDTNGAVCMTAVQSTGTGLGSDLGGVYLVHVPATTWQPPAMVGSVTPASLALTDAKYGIVASPSATQYIYTGGYYASTAWYQPKYASSYADIARFGKDRYTGAYCMQGSGASSYFSAPAAGVQLQSAVTLAAGAIALGSAILAM